MRRPGLSGTAIGSFVVCLLFDAGAVPAVYIAVKPWLGWTQRRRYRPPRLSPVPSMRPADVPARGT